MEITASPKDVDICVCTFRRASVTDTLRSLAKLTLASGWHLRIIVADNDDTPSARTLVETTAREHALNVTYVHAPARNISIARNACLAVATAPMVAFIDDDEMATPAWLESLITTAQHTKADVVLGPVKATYDPATEEWFRAGDFHSTEPVWVEGKIITGYTCNVLLTRTPAITALRFREDLGRSGGEDTVFFAAVHKAGGTFAYAPEAIVTEEVPPERATLTWLLKRRFRSGQTHGLLLLEANASLAARSKNILVASAKALFCYGAALGNILSDERLCFWLLRGTMHVGAVSRLLGKRELVQYG